MCHCNRPESLLCEWIVCPLRNQIHEIVGEPAYIGLLSYLPFNERSNNSTQENNEIFENLIVNPSDILKTNEVDINELLILAKKITLLIDNIPSSYKKIATEQIDILLNLNLEVDRVELPKEAEMALLVLRGIYLP